MTLRSTHQQQFQVVPPSGKQVSITAIDIVRCTADKIVERWGVADQGGMLQQLGATPAPG